MKDPDWLVRPIIPKRPRSARPLTLDRPPAPMLPIPGEPKRVPERPPLPRRSQRRSPFHP